MLVVEDVLEPLVDDDLVLVLFYAAEAGVSLETGETGVGHGGEEQRNEGREPIRRDAAEILSVRWDRARACPKKAGQ